MRIVYIITKVLGVLLMTSAFLTWIAYNYPDYNIFKLGGGGILSIGIAGTIGLMLNWILVVIQAAAGWYLFTLKPKSSQEETTNTEDH